MGVCFPIECVYSTGIRLESRSNPDPFVESDNGRSAKHWAIVLMNPQDISWPRLTGDTMVSFV